MSNLCWDLYFTFFCRWFILFQNDHQWMTLVHCLQLLHRNIVKIIDSWPPLGVELDKTTFPQVFKNSQLARSLNKLIVNIVFDIFIFVAS